MTVIIGIVVAYVFGRSLTPTDATVRGHVFEVNLDEIPPGTVRTFAVPGSLIQVLHRTSEDIENLGKVNQYLRDPDSFKSQQPPYTRNSLRSVKPEWFISFGHTSRRGFPVIYAEQLPRGYEGRLDWFGGFYDRYDGAPFDKAGHVYSVAHPDELNLPIPEHKYVTDNRVVIYPFGL